MSSICRFPRSGCLLYRATAASTTSTISPRWATQNPFGGIGDNQLGVELSGHNANSYTRYAFSVLSSVDGNPDDSWL